MWMNAEQHRRLIGNDVVFIIFHDSDSSFDPSPLNALGTVPQVFGVVQKYQEDSYRYFLACLLFTSSRLGFFSRPNIKPYHPFLPADVAFHSDDVKDFLFTKGESFPCLSDI
jgi:hypothetical protein